MFIAYGPRAFEEPFHPGRGSVLQGGWVPAGLPVLVDEQGTYALLQIALNAAMQGRNVFLPEHIGERQ